MNDGKMGIHISIQTIKLQSVCLNIVGNKSIRRFKWKNDVSVLFDSMLTELGEPILSENSVPIIQE